MKKWFEQFKTEDWVVVAVSILLLAFAIITPNYLPRIPKHLADTESWGNAIFLFCHCISHTLYRLAFTRPDP